MSETTRRTLQAPPDFPNLAPLKSALQGLTSEALYLLQRRWTRQALGDILDTFDRTGATKSAREEAGTTGHSNDLYRLTDAAYELEQILCSLAQATHTATVDATAQSAGRLANVHRFLAMVGRPPDDVQASQGVVESTLNGCLKVVREMASFSHWRKDETMKQRDACPSCGADLVGVLYEDGWFTATGGHPGDSGAGGNTPQDPVAWGVQECPECRHKWEVSG